MIHPQAERAAQAALGALWDETLPVDPIQIARRLDILVSVANLDAGWSGALVKRGAGEQPTILLNARDSITRQRFSCAHELGHWFQRAASGASDDDAFEYVDKRDERASHGTDPRERYANGFAAALLMPAEEVRKRFSAGEPVAVLAWTFEVSPEAMAHRLANLGLRG